VDQVMTAEPYASARRVFWVVDNGASHRNWAAAARLSDACPHAQMVHLPVHASWLNQVEIYFSVIQRKFLTPDDFADLDSLAGQILAFERHCNATARPFDWTFTRTDLNRLLTRLGRHDPFAPPSSIPPATTCSMTPPSTDGFRQMLSRMATNSARQTALASQWSMVIIQSTLLGGCGTYPFLAGTTTTSILSQSAQQYLFTTARRKELNGRSGRSVSLSPFMSCI
jgi:hypothetical protein